MSKGIVYIATGESFWLVAAIKSAIALGGKENVVIFSDLVQNSRINEQIFIKNINYLGLDFNKPFVSRQLKTMLHMISPFEKTLFLDADTLPIGDLSRIWGQKGVSIGLSLNKTIGECDHISKEEKKFTIALLGEDYPHRSSAVILFEKSKDANSLFADWQHTWQVYQKHDQLALARAIGYKYNINPLPEQYNRQYQASVSELTVFESGTIVNYSGSANKTPFIEK